MNHLHPEILEHFKEDKEIQEKIESRLDSIDTKLGNHIVHIIADITQIKTNIDWMKKSKESPEDQKQDANIEWTSWIARSMITAIISLASAVVVALLLRK